MFIACHSACCWRVAVLFLLTGPAHASAAAFSEASLAFSATVNLTSIIVNISDPINVNVSWKSFYTLSNGLCKQKNNNKVIIWWDGRLTSSSFILISFSVSTSGVDSGRKGTGLSTRLSCVSLLAKTKLNFSINLHFLLSTEEREIYLVIWCMHWAL